MRQELLTTGLASNRPTAFRGLIAAAAGIALAIGVAYPTYGATKTWNNTGTDFNNSAFWTGGSPGAADIGQFSGPANAGFQPDISGNISVSGLDFGVATNSAGYVLTSTGPAVLTLLSTSASAGSAALTGRNTSGVNTISADLNLGAALGSTQTFTQATGGTLVLNGTISGGGATNTLTYAGTGTYKVNDANTYTGTTNQTGTNVIVVGNKDAFGSSTLNFGSVNTGGSHVQAPMTLTGTNKITNAITMTTTTGVTIDNGYAIEFSGPVNLNGAARIITNNNIASTTFSGVISNDGGLGLTLSAGTGSVLALSGTNTYTGGTIIKGAGAVRVTSLGNAGANGNVGQGQVSLGSSSLDGTLIYSGAGETSSKVLNLNGTTGNVTIDTTGASGGLVLTANLTATGNGAKPLILQGDSVGNEIKGAIVDSTGATSLRKSGTGTWTLSGVSTYTGSTVVLNGTLNLDYTAANTSRIPDNSILIWGGGTVNLSGGAYTEVVKSNTAGTTSSFVPGESTLTRTSGTSVLQLGAFNFASSAIGRNGASINFTAPDLATTDTTNSNGILGGWATINGADWAYNATNGANGAIEAFTAYDVNNNAATWTANQNITNTAAFTGTAPTVSINSLRFNAAAASTVTIGAANTLTVQSDGILVTANVGDNASVITGGTLVPTQRHDLVVQQFNTQNSLTIASTITDNGNSGTPVKLTKAGPGLLNLTGANVYSGQTFINNGVLNITDIENGGVASNIGQSTNVADSLDLDGGTLRYTGNGSVGQNSTTDRLFSLGAKGGTIDASGTGGGVLNFGNTGSIGFITRSLVSQVGERTLTLTGVNTGANTLAVSIGDNGGATSVTKTGVGRWVLSGTSTYTGATTVSQGTLQVDGSIANSAVTVTGGATLQGHGTVGTVSGGGLVSPGNSPGVLTATSVNPAGGMDFGFEFTSTGSPTYSTPGSSVNDVLRLTDLGAPFTSALNQTNGGTPGNVISIYFDTASPLNNGQVFRGAFYTNLATDFLASISGATFEYYLLGNGLGSHTFNGVNYYSFSELLSNPIVTVSTVAETANFGAGNVNGRVTQFSLLNVPEPASAVVLGLAGTLALLRRHRRSSP